MIGSRVMAVGDVHGEYEKLKKLMRRIKFDPAQDILIFLGDLIDRGPESLQCFDYVMHLQKQYPDSVIYLMGNHEREMLDYFDALAETKDELGVRLLNRTSEWLAYGGDRTCPNYRSWGPKRCRTGWIMQGVCRSFTVSGTIISAMQGWIRMFLWSSSRKKT